MSQNNITLQHPIAYASRFLWVIKNFTKYHEDTTLVSPEFVFNVVDGLEDKLKFEITGRDSYNDFMLICSCELLVKKTFGVNYSMIDKTGEVILNERRQVCDIKLLSTENSHRWLLIESDDLKDLIFKNGTIILVVDITDADIDKNLITDLLKNDSDNKKIIPSKVFKQFSDFYQMKDLCDFKIIVEDAEYPVHKFALAARSPVFATLFINEANSVRGDSMKISDFPRAVVQEMLHYVYRGTVNNIDELAKDLLVIGDKYNIDGLVDLCTEHLKKKINVDNVFPMLAFATKYNVEALKLAAHLFFIGNTKKILQSEAFNEIINSFAYSFDSKI